MKLTLAVIRDYLPSRIRMDQYGAAKHTVLLDRPVLYETGAKLEQDKLYIGSASKFPLAELPENAAAICVGRMPGEQIVPYNVSWCSVSEEHSVHTVFNAVQKVYDYFEKWDYSMLQQLSNEREFDIKKLIKTGVQMLENPFFMMNASAIITFSSSVSANKKGQLVIRVNDTPQALSLTQTANMKEVCTSERLIRVPYISSVPRAKNDDLRAYCYNLYPMDYFLGCAWFKETNRTFRDSDYFLANHFFQYFQNAFWKYLLYSERKESLQVAAFEKLIRGEDLNQEEHALFSLKNGEEWVCFSLRENSSKKHLPRDYMYASMNSLISNSCIALMRRETIIGLLRIQESSGKNQNSTYAQFEAFVNQMGYMGGYSRAFTEIRRVNDFIVQAEFAAKYAAEEEETLVFFEQHLLDFLMYSSTKLLPFENLLSKGYLALQEYDHKKGTNLLETLDAFLKNEMNISATAEQLYIHRSSLQKRLNRILQITGHNFEDPDVRLYYRICLKHRKNRMK